MPKLTKPAMMALGGLGSSLGVGAAAVGGWQFYERANPTAHRVLADNNYVWSPKTMNMNMELIVDATKSETNNFNFTPQGCFGAMFPGAKADPKIASATVVPTDPLASKADLPPEQTYGTDPVGCAMVQMTNRGREKLAAKYEVTAKNDKWGWVLWTGIKYVKQTNVQHDAMSVVMFLRKNEKGEWGVWGGYFWNDPHVTNQFGKLHLVTPEGETSIDPQNEAHPSEKSYAGVWEAAPEGGKEIFRDLELWNGQDSQRSERTEILGREPASPGGQMFDEVGQTNYCLYGYSCLSGVYTAENGWRKFNESKQPNGGKTLNQWYRPFRGKRGGWTPLEGYCAAKSSVRNAGAAELDRVRTFCFAKAVSAGS